MKTDHIGQTRIFATKGASYALLTFFLLVFLQSIGQLDGRDALLQLIKPLPIVAPNHAQSPLAIALGWEAAALQRRRQEAFVDVLYELWFGYGN